MLVLVYGDIRTLPFASNSFDISHVRFVIAHLGQDKAKAIQEVVRVTKPGGRAIFLDFDWSTAHGSLIFNRFRDFLINGGSLFDADFGAILEQTIRSAFTDDNSSITTKIFRPQHMIDYSPVLRLREAGVNDFKVQGKNEEAKTWEKLLDNLLDESKSQNPPGFFFPGIVIVTVMK